jgi:hypothetical protein
MTGAEVVAGAALRHPSVIKHRDLVHLVWAVPLVGDQQGGPAGRGRQQIRGQCAAVFRVEVSPPVHAELEFLDDSVTTLIAKFKKSMPRHFVILR